MSRVYDITVAVSKSASVQLTMPIVELMPCVASTVKLYTMPAGNFGGSSFMFSRNTMTVLEYIFLPGALSPEAALSLATMVNGYPVFPVS